MVCILLRACVIITMYFLKVGITSWGIGCGAVDVPGVYASIPSSLCFIDWATQCVYGNKYKDEYYDIEVNPFKESISEH